MFDSININGKRIMDRGNNAAKKKKRISDSEWVPILDWLDNTFTFNDKDTNGCISSFDLNELYTKKSFKIDIKSFRGYLPGYLKTRRNFSLVSGTPLPFILKVAEAVPKHNL